MILIGAEYKETFVKVRYENPKNVYYDEKNYEVHYIAYDNCHYILKDAGMVLNRDNLVTQIDTYKNKFLVERDHKSITVKKVENE